MDERAFEMASEREELERQAAIARRVQYQGVSAHECEECGEPIPQGRREALPGVQTCFSCQSIMEVRRG